MCMQLVCTCTLPSDRECMWLTTYIRYSGEECAHLPIAWEASKEANVVAHDAQPLRHRRVLKAAHKVLCLLLAPPKPAAQTQHISRIHLLQSLLSLTLCCAHSTTCIPSGLFCCRDM